MKFTTILLLAACLQVSASGFSQTVTLSLKNASLQKVFKEINRQTGYEFFFKDELLKQAGKLDINVKNLSLEDVLKQCFSNQPLTFTIIDKTIVIKEKKVVTSSPVDPLPVLVKGRVTDAAGLPLTGATVQIKGTRVAVITDKEGNFSIDTKPGQVLIISYVGFISTETVITKDSPVLQIALTIRPAELNTVALISTGYQQLPKERSAGSFSTVTNEAIKNKSVSMNLIDRLEGLVPGLSINYGRSTDRFLMRGLTSINADKTPLFVVDGVPMNNVSSLTSLINPEDVESVNFLRDATASSIWGSAAANGVIVITTRKGKISTSPKKIQVNYSGFASFRGQPDLDYYNMMNSQPLVGAAKEIFDIAAYPWATVTTSASNNSSPVVVPHEQVMYDLARGIITQATADKLLDSLSFNNHQDQISNFLFQNSFLSNHSINFNGGSDYHSYYGSISYTSDKSYNRTNLDRYQVNLRQDFNFSKAIRLDLTANMSYEKSSKFLLTDFPGTASTLLPYVQLEDYSGNPLSLAYLLRHDPFRATSENQSRINLNYIPLLEPGNTKNNTNNLIARINAGLTIKLWKGLSYEGRAQYQHGANSGYEYYNQNAYKVRNERVYFTQAATTPGGNPTYYLPTTGGHYLTSNTAQRAWTVRNQFSYDNTLAKKHQLTMLAGSEIRSSYSNSLGSFKRGYDFQTQSFSYIDEIFLGSTGVTNPVNFLPSRTVNVLRVNQLSYGEQERRFFSLYGNMAYTFDRKYTLNGSIRMDQSNLFGSDPSTQYKPIWSIGGAWNITQEKFFHSRQINNLKLRLTYGLAGNAPVPGQGGPYDIVGARNNAIFSGLGIGYVLFTPKNDLLSWERTATTNAGIDFGIWKNRISGSVDVYQKITNALLGYVPLDPTTGYSYAYDNLGSLSNKGVEIMLNTHNIHSEKLNWRTTFTLSYNKNRVNELKRLTNLSFSQKLSGTQMEGYSAYPIFGFNYIGLNNAGNPMGLSQTNDTIRLSTQVKVDDPVYAGTTQPLWYGGITNSVSYKNLSFSFLIVYNMGHKMRRDVNQFYTGRLTRNIPEYFTNRWKVAGDETKTDIPKYIANTATSTSSRYTSLYTNALQNIVSASYAKLRDITLNYSFNKGLTQRFSMSSLDVYAQVNNILLWTKNKDGIDPEYYDLQQGVRADRMPAFYTIGIRASFK